MMRCLWPALVKQLNDLRTSVAKESCNLIVWFAMEYPHEFCTQSYKPAMDHHSVLTCLGGGNGVRMFKDDALPRLVASGNKLLQDLGHQTMQEIVEHTPPIQTIIPHLTALVSNKNNLLRLRIAQYFEMILSAAVGYSNGTIKSIKAGTKEIIEQNSEIIDYFLIRATDDQN